MGPYADDDVGTDGACGQLEVRSCTVRPWASRYGPLPEGTQRKAESAKQKADHMPQQKLTAAHEADKNTKLIAAERPKAPNKAEPRKLVTKLHPRRRRRLNQKTCK